MNTDPELESLMSHLGDWGTYQFRQHILHILSAFLAGLHMLSLTTVVPTPPHRCMIEDIDSNITSEAVFAHNQSFLEQYVPYKDGVAESCFRYDLETNETVRCEKFVFDNTYYKESKVIELGLVCDKRWERAVIQSIYMFGVLIGAIVLGPLADKYGRKTIFYISGILQLIAGLVCAFVAYFPVYCLTLFFYGMFGSGGAYVTGFVLTMELVGPSKRTLCGTAFSAAFAFGVMVVAVWGYFISDVTVLQVIYALHSLCLIAHWWLVDESIRWLWGQGRVKEAVDIVERAVKVNGSTLTRKFEGKLNKEEEEESGGFGISDLFKTPRLRSRTLNVAFNWFANSLVYYGLSLNSGSLEGNPFVVLFLIGLAEVPGYLIVIFLVDLTGRRSMCCTLMLFGGFACIIVAFIAKGLLVTVIVMFGKMAIAGSFAVIYNYTAELFPTVVRNSAVGVGAMAARFSGMLTPLLTLLDSVDKQLPTIIFGTVAIVAGLLALFLPETLNKEMPQTIEDGENFGRGDTGFKTCANCLQGRRRQDEPEVGIRLHQEQTSQLL